jgi:hypothetical protein
MHWKLEPLIWPLLIATLALLAIPHFVHGQDIPDPNLTPGVARTDLTTEQVCKTKWGKDRRAVTATMKKAVFVSYGIKCGKRCGKLYEVDHLISREVGGADDGKNLWPQPYAGQWNAHDKDRVENRLHKEICTGNLTLEDAQSMLRDDWTKAFVKYFGEKP